MSKKRDVSQELEMMKQDNAVRLKRLEIDLISEEISQLQAQLKGVDASVRLEAAKADATHQNAVLRAKKKLRDALQTALAVDDAEGDSDADSEGEMAPEDVVKADGPGADQGAGSYGYGSP